MFFRASRLFGCTYIGRNALVAVGTPVIDPMWDGAPPVHQPQFDVLFHWAVDCTATSFLNCPAEGLRDCITVFFHVVDALAGGVAQLHIFVQCFHREVYRARCTL